MFLKDYKSVLSEYERFWQRSNKERPILNISYPKEGAVPYRQANSPEEKWLDVQYSYNAFKAAVSNTGYLAEGVPMCFTNFGPGCLSACIGGGFKLRENTIWFDTEQLVDEWENPPAISFNENSVIWKKVLEAQALYAKDDDVHFSITDIGGIMDIVASLRGTQNLLYDLYDYPDDVKEFAAKVKAEWYKAFDIQVEILRHAGQPFNNWMNIPSAKPWYPLQCDFSYCISPKQFSEFILGDLADMAAYMDRSIYHYDGVGQLPHADMILDIPELTGIQWIPGPGTVEAPLTDEKWYSFYRKIQDKKKNIVLINGISEYDLPGAERLIKSIDPAGVYISIDCSTREVAEDMLEKVTRWSV